MEGMGKELVNGAKEAAKNLIKEQAKKIGLMILKWPYTYLIIAIIIIIIIVTGYFMDVEAQAYDDTQDMSSATSGGRWEQFLRYLIYNEGGGTSPDGQYYMVEDDGAGNPTVGHGLCLKNVSDGTYLNVAAFQEFGIDSKKLADDWLAGNRDGKVSIEICDQIYESIAKSKFDTVKSKYSHLGLTIYQLYALTDVTYRRGNTQTFEEKYNSLWVGSNHEYYKGDISKETFSEGSLYSFFWNGGHSLPGVNTRKKNQWLLFKYGWYQPLNEWCEQTGEEGEFTYDSADDIAAIFTSDSTGNQFIAVKQWKISGWEQKCNRGAAVAIITGLTSKTKDEAIEICNTYEDKGPFSEPSVIGTYFDPLNLSYTSKSGSDYREVVKEVVGNGGAIALYLNKPTGKSRNSANTWATTAHWIAIVGLREKNGGLEMAVMDTGHSNNGWYPIDEFYDVRYILYTVY